MAGLMAATCPIAVEGGFRVTLDQNWEIWGPAGGYLAAIVLRVIGEVAEDGHRPVSLTGQFIRVAERGTVDVSVTPVKTGRSAFYTVSLLQGDQLIFTAQIWTTNRHDASVPIMPTMPDVLPPAACLSISDHLAQRGFAKIAFWDNLDGRLSNPRFPDDPPPENPRQQRWMRFQDWAETDNPFWDAMRTALLIDIGVWPAHWHRMTENIRYMAPSLDLTVWFHGGAPGSTWLLADADADTSGHGTISGQVRIWADDGRLLATGGGHCLVVTPKGAD